MAHLQTSRLLLLVAVCCVALPASTGCGPAPTLPSRTGNFGAAVPTTPAWPPPVPGTPASMLSLSAFAARLLRFPGTLTFYYEPATLEVIETSGTHSATLYEVTLTAEGGWDESRCPLREHIGPGERLDLVKRLSYCLPFMGTPAEVAAVTITAKFVDEKNVGGQVQKTLSVAGCTLAGATGSAVCR